MGVGGGRGRGTWVCRGGGGGAHGCVGVEGAHGCVGVEGEGHMGVWRRGGAYEYNGNEIGGAKLHTV